MTDLKLTAVVSAFIEMASEALQRAGGDPTLVELAKVLGARHYQQVGSARRGDGSTSYTLLIRWMDKLRDAGLGDAILTVGKEGPRLSFVFPDGTVSEYPDRVPEPKRDAHGMTPEEKEAIMQAALLRVNEPHPRTNTGRMSPVDEARSMYPLQDIPRNAGPSWFTESPTPPMPREPETLLDALVSLVSIIQGCPDERVVSFHIPMSLKSHRSWDTFHLWGAQVYWEAREDIRAGGSKGTVACRVWPVSWDAHNPPRPA